MQTQNIPWKKNPCHTVQAHLALPSLVQGMSISRVHTCARLQATAAAMHSTQLTVEALVFNAMQNRPIL